MKSKGAKHVGKLLKEVFPTHSVLTEKYIKYSNTQLFFDFFIPEFKLAIEVQGEQHFHFNKFFHKDSVDFKKQKYRDSLKTQWAAEESIKILAITDKEANELNPLTFKQLVLNSI